MSQPINLVTTYIFYYFSHAFYTVIPLLSTNSKPHLITELISQLTISKVCCPLHQVQLLFLITRNLSTQNKLSLLTLNIYWGQRYSGRTYWRSQRNQRLLWRCQGIFLGQSWKHFRAPHHRLLLYPLETPHPQADKTLGCCLIIENTYLVGRPQWPKSSGNSDLTVW